MISSQILWPLDHEAGQIQKYNKNVFWACCKKIQLGTLLSGAAHSSNMSPTHGQEVDSRKIWKIVSQRGKKKEGMIEGGEFSENTRDAKCVVSYFSWHSFLLTFAHFKNVTSNRKRVLLLLLLLSLSSSSLSSYICHGFDVWLTVHRSSMWNKKPTGCQCYIYFSL